MAAVQTLWRPLGQLLVQKGLLTGEQLDRALEEQSVTSRRLGEVLVELGYITQSALSLALSEQYGFELPLESGFGTGLRVQLERRQDDPVDAASVETEVAAAEHDPDLEPLARLEEQWARLAAAEEQLVEATRELEALRRLHERRRTQVVRLVGRIRRASRPVRAEPITGHVVFVRCATGYDLVEQDGVPPMPGASLRLPQLSDNPFVVTRVGRSPLPHDGRPCAFAEPLRSLGGERRPEQRHPVLLADGGDRCPVG